MARMQPAGTRRGTTGQGRRRKYRPYLTTTEVARQCACSVRTVAAWIDRGLLRGYRLPGGAGQRSGQRRVFRRDLQVFLLAHGMLVERPAETAVEKTQQLIDFHDDRPAEVRKRPRPKPKPRRIHAEWPYDRVEGFPLLAGN